MAVSEVSICNSALALLAANRILVLGDDDSIESVLCEDVYETARNELLEAADWSFAIDRIQLAAAAETPAFGWDYKVLLPGNHLRTIAVWEDSDLKNRMEYLQEGQYLLVNSVPAYLRYIKVVTDPTEFSALFIRALYTSIAAKLCITLTEDMKRETTLSQQVEFYIDEAAATDGLQGSQERLTSNTFIKVR